MRKSRIFIISAPSGSGKTTICNRVVERVENLIESISLTTRRPRSGEEHAKDYHYVSPEEFKEEIKKENLLEWEENFGYFYGTPKDLVVNNLKEGKDVLLSIDVKGAKKVKNIILETTLIFIKPPSFEELSRRLKTRNTDNEKEIETRLNLAEKEIEASKDYEIGRAHV